MQGTRRNLDICLCRDEEINTKHGISVQMILRKIHDEFYDIFPKYWCSSNAFKKQSNGHKNKQKF